MRKLGLTLACVIGIAALAAVLVWADDASPDNAFPDRASSVVTGPLLRPSVVVPHRDGDTARGAVLGSPSWPPYSAHAAAVHTTTIELPTYRYTNCLLPRQVGVAGVPFRALDWGCMLTVGLPVPRTYELLVLSNEYLTVTLLPELGGRIYQMIFKPTGHNELYSNEVVKPTPWGPPEQGWWLATGGLEWGFPTDEHGYEWGIPWTYRVSSSASGVTVTLRDSQVITRPTVAVDVHLPADQAALVLRPQITNPTAAPADVKYWTTALLAPGPYNAPSADLRFLFPTDQVIVHSTDNLNLPQPGELMDWPVYDGRDYARLGNWDKYLGFFEAPYAHGPFAGVYDAGVDEGVLRVYPATVAKGSKGYASGWQNPLPSWLWTDDGSGYVEVHGGLMPTFWDTATLSSGQVVSWSEVWYPVAGVGGVSNATQDAALRLESVDNALSLGLYTPAERQDVDFYLWRDDCTTLGHWRLRSVGPTHPVAITLPASELTTTDELSLVAITADDAVLGGVNLRDCLPPIARVGSLPHFVTSSTFSVEWPGHDTWSGIADYDVQYREGYGGEWVEWLAGTPAISAVFSGQAGQTYFFRARARDRAGNVGSYGDEEWGQSFTSVLPTPSPVLVTSRKLAVPPNPVLGRPVTYTMLLSNTGNSAAVSLALTDHLPVTLAYVSGTLRAGGARLTNPRGDVITWQGTLTPGQAFTLTFAMTATAATPIGEPLINSLSVTAEGTEPLERRATIAYSFRVYLPLLGRRYLTP
jgi:uncharacterized repeat protein (TIGR01451 family)